MIRKLIYSLLVCIIFFFNVSLWAKPMVLKAYPDISQKNIKTDVTLEVYFNEDMDSSSINDKTFKLIDESGKKIEGRVSYDQNLKKAYFKPSSILNNGTVYLIVLSHNIKNKKGETFQEAYRWVFKTAGKKLKDMIAYRKFGPPVLINPKNKSIISDNLKLEWKGKAKKYHVKVFYGKNVVIDVRVYNSYLNINRYLKKGVYAWKVRAYNGRKWSGFSPKAYCVVK